MATTSMAPANSHFTGDAGAAGAMGRLAGVIVVNQMDDALRERLQSERMMFFAKAGSISVVNGCLAKLPVKADNVARLPHLTRTEILDLLLHKTMRAAATQERLASEHPSLYWNIRLAGDSKNWNTCLRTILLSSVPSLEPYTGPLDWEALAQKHDSSNTN
jgi:hypothetical protein